MNPAHDVHWGRDWYGHATEDACPCPQAPCGLIADPDPTCPDHGKGWLAYAFHSGHFVYQCGTDQA